MQSERNEFPGVNLHFNSFLQQEGGGWEAFYAYPIIDLANILDARLPSNYYAVAEQSLQISAIEPQTGEAPGRKARRTPDVSVTFSQRFGSAPITVEMLPGVNALLVKASSRFTIPADIDELAVTAERCECQYVGFARIFRGVMHERITGLARSEGSRAMDAASRQR